MGGESSETPKKGILPMPTSGVNTGDNGKFPRVKIRDDGKQWLVQKREGAGSQEVIISIAKAVDPSRVPPL